MTGDAGRQRGRRARISREQFLAAGQVVATRSLEEPPRSLRSLLNVPLADVLAEAGKGENTPVTSPLLYTHWSDYESYLESLLHSMFDPGVKLPTDHLDSDSRAPSERLREHIRRDLIQADDQAGLYLGLFAGVSNDTTRDVLQAIYSGYDQQLLGPISRALVEDGRRIRPEFGVGETGVLNLMRVLTALTEGFAVRRVVQSQDLDVVLIQEAALGVYQKFTELLEE